LISKETKKPFSF